MALKKSYSKDKNICNVTFTVSPEAAQGAKKITIAGDFNSWSSDRKSTRLNSSH